MSLAQRFTDYSTVLKVCLPLGVSMGTATVMEFTDRVFLSNYDLDALAAAMPASIASLLFASLFMGTGGYVNVFVAQYLGAARPDRVGRALWQGIHFSLLSGILLALLALFAKPLFSWAGHGPTVQAMEEDYYIILCLGGWLNVLAATLSCFFSGQGYTRQVMVVNFLGAAVNIPLDYALINGVWGFPEWGIVGAGVATVTAWGVTAALFAAIIFRPCWIRRFDLLGQWRIDLELFGRLMRYGLPSGAIFFLDMFAFTFFIFMVGRIGPVELAATNITFSINMLAFMPLVGFHIGMGTLVGNAVGKGDIAEAHRLTMRTLELAVFYAGIMAVFYLFFPDVLLSLFGSGDTGPEVRAELIHTGRVLLRFVAFYSIFDAIALILSGSVKGAGDTSFVMGITLALAISLMVVPVWAGIAWFGMGLIGAWSLASLYILLLAVCYSWRYRSGRWKQMNVLGRDQSGPAVR